MTNSEKVVRWGDVTALGRFVGYAFLEEFTVKHYELNQLRFQKFGALTDASGSKDQTMYGFLLINMVNTEKELYITFTSVHSCIFKQQSISNDFVNIKEHMGFSVSNLK